MRRKYFGLALAAITTLGPLGMGQSTGWAGDREIAEQIISKLRAGRDSGDLKDFSLDMKVDEGVVLFRGSVAAEAQKQFVMQTVKGIEGIANVVDEVKVEKSQPVAKVIKPAAHVTPASNEGFSFREALAKKADQIRSENQPTFELPEAVDLSDPLAELAEAEAAKEQAENAEPAAGMIDSSQALAASAPEAPSIVAEEEPLVVPGEIARTAAAAPMVEQPIVDPDQQITDAVIKTLGQAQRGGSLKGFGLDVTTADGVVSLVGKARNSDQRDLIVRLTQQTAGVQGVRESITLLHETVRPETVRPVSNLQHMNLQPAPKPQVSAPQPPVMAAPYRMQGPTAAAPVSSVVGAPVGAPVMGQPVPMGGYQGMAGPRYDQPNLPNYAWPGYAAYPNYAAVTYPQQYSPSAFPYIGPFYPYPQVPLGWRRVSLEWDDGWWFLDFTDR